MQMANDSFVSGFAVGLLVGVGLVAVGVFMIRIPLVARLSVARTVVQNKEKAEVVRNDQDRIQGYVAQSRGEQSRWIEIA